jgi:hypothetical protein
VLRERRAARERAEVVRRLVDDEPADRPFRIDRHLAHGIDGEVVDAVIRADDREDLHRLGDVAQHLPAAGLVEHAVEIGSESGHAPGDEHLSAACERRHARGDVDRRPEVVAAAVDGRAEVATDADGRRLVAARRAPRDPEAEPDCVARVRHAQHERVADRLHVLAADLRQLRLHRRRELLDEPDRLLVPVRLGQRGEARDVREQEGGRVACHAHNLRRRSSKR